MFGQRWHHLDVGLHGALPQPRDEHLLDVGEQILVHPVLGHVAKVAHLDQDLVHAGVVGLLPAVEPHGALQELPVLRGADGTSVEQAVDLERFIGNSLSES